MRRLAPLLVAIVLSLTGCFGAETAAPDTPSRGVVLEGFELEGAAPESVDDRRARLRWEGAVGASAGGATGSNAIARLLVPAGPDITLTSTLTWEAEADLELFVRDDEGTLKCSGTRGFHSLSENIETCLTSASESRNESAWSIEVLAFDAPRAETPFILEVLVTRVSMPSVDADVAARFGEPVLVGPGADGETSLFIADDGTMLVCSHGAFRKPSPVWASLDLGATWTALDPQPNPVPSGDCDVAITDEGTWYMMYDTIASATVASSPDQGRTWQVQPIAAQPVTGAVDRPWLLPDGNDITMTYANAAALLPAAQFFTRSTDRGLTWPVHTPMATAEPDRVQKVPGHPISWDDGRELLAPTLARVEVAGYDVGSSLVIHRSHDAGLTWASATVAGPFETPLSIAGAARTPDGTLFLSYPRGTVNNATIEVVWSTDDGATWSEPLLVATQVGSRTVTSPFLDPAPDGTVALAWLQTTAGPDRMTGNQLWVARIDVAADEPLVYAGAITEPDPLPFIYEFIMVRHDVEGRAHVAYVQSGEGCADDPAIERSKTCLFVVRENPR